MKGFQESVCKVGGGSWEAGFALLPEAKIRWRICFLDAGEWPGSGNQRGLPEKAAGLWGICRGYQMLGSLLEDPEGVEHGGSLAGIGLLPVVTRFRGKKHRTRVEGNVGKLSGVFEQMSGTRAEGYEIHG